MASSRKRRTPQHIDLTAKIPRYSSIAGAEATAQSGSDNHSLFPLSERSNSVWDGLLSTHTLNLQEPRKREIGKKRVVSPVVQDDSFPHAELSAATLSSLPIAPTSCDTSHIVCVVPILHQHMYHAHMVEKLLHSRQHASMEVVKECGLAEGNSGCVYVGDVVMGLDGPLDIGAVFREGKSSTRLSLVLEGELHSGLEGVQGGDIEDVGGRWLLKLEVGETVNYLQLKMDPRFAAIHCQHVGRMMQKTASLMKLFLAQNAESHILLNSLQLEVWALKMMYHLGSASELGAKLTYQPLYSLFVKTLYSMEEMEMNNDSPNGGLL